MARIFKIRELEDKKRALAEECDLYRQTLALEVQNLKMQAVLTKRRFTSLSASPLWAFLPQLLSSFSKGKTRKSSKWRMLSTALAMWQVYRKFRGFISLFSRVRRTHTAEEERVPAATI